MERKQASLLLWTVVAALLSQNLVIPVMSAPNFPTGLIWGLFGWIGTVGRTFGVTSLTVIGANMNLLQALSNTGTIGFGELYRAGTAALLNSMAHSRFPYTTTQVRDSFVSALSSNKAAAAQARLFKLANEGRTKPRALTCFKLQLYHPDLYVIGPLFKPDKAKPTLMKLFTA